MYPVKIIREDVFLRELTMSDVTDLHRVYGSPRATEHLSFEPRTPEQTTTLLKNVVTKAQENPRVEYSLAAALNTDNTLIGLARLAIGEHRSGQIGFALHPDHWNRGLGRQTVSLLLELGFQHLGLHRIWGARSPHNHRSARLMQSLGMIEEGRIRDHLFTRGAWRDSIVHSLLEDEHRPNA
jgi:[ribosomal protein S5]-alanine N-acetyltransferase